MLYDTTQRLSFHIEVTDKCNARCIQCSRNMIDSDGKLKQRPDLFLTELTLKDFKKIFKNFKYPVRFISMCGNFGDAFMAKDIFEITEYLWTEVLDLSYKPFMNIHTNGGMRNKEWWYEYGKMVNRVSGGRDLVTFSIDGLEDTHHLYRVNTRYDRVVENARAYIAGGGNAEWSFIRFGHNQHQEEEAKRRAKEYGFSFFIPVDTQRFWTKEHIEYKWRNKTYRILSPKTNEYEDKKNKAVKYKKNKKQALKKSISNIECSVSKKNELFIDCRGDVHPCCWIGSWSYRNSKGIYNFVEDPEKHPIMEMRTIRNAIKEDLSEIITDDFFQYILPMSFEVSPSHICIKQCSKTEKFITTKKRSYTGVGNTPHEKNSEGQKWK